MATLLPPRRIAVFRALQLGDLLCAVPALRALRHAWPEARITLIGLPWARDFVARMPYLDDFLPFPGFPGLPEITPNYGAIPEFLCNARAHEFDLAIQMHGSGELTNPIVAMLGARHTAGFVPPGGWCMEPERYLGWPEHLHELRRLLALTEFLGAPSLGEHIELPLHDAEKLAFEDLQEEFDLRAGGYVCIHPGARLPSRRWLPERFARVADWAADQDFQIVLTGMADEAGIAETVKAHMKAPVIDLVGRTSLGTLAAIVRDARLVISNDTGISHVAAALESPSVVICCGADAKRWQPLDTALHPVVWADTPCRPCNHAYCPTAHECATGVPTARVIATASALLKKSALPDKRSPVNSGGYCLEAGSAYPC
jgi:ADP-heptose:LPS heptosyltransferase